MYLKNLSYFHFLYKEVFILVLIKLQNYKLDLSPEANLGHVTESRDRWFYQNSIKAVRKPLGKQNANGSGSSVVWDSGKDSLPAKEGQEQCTGVKGKFLKICFFFSPYHCLEKTTFCPFTTEKHISGRPVPTRVVLVTLG